MIHEKYQVITLGERRGEERRGEEGVNLTKQLNTSSGVSETILPMCCETILRKDRTMGNRQASYGSHETSFLDIVTGRRRKKYATDRGGKSKKFN